jgi:aldose 1-epimerase
VTGILREPFGTAADGRVVEQVTLENARGMRVSVLTLGGIIRSIWAPDADGALADVVLGFDTVEDYLADGMYVGALIGRYANRIAGGRFTLDGVDYQLPLNHGPNQLHGGSAGFHRAIWSPRPRETDAGQVLQLRYRSRGGEEGFPGTLDVSVTYLLTDANELSLAYHAITDEATPVTLTSHGYFNLAGAGSGSALAHELTLGASRFTPLNPSMIPTGEVRSVSGTPFDFRRPSIVGARLGVHDEQLAIAYGYDHNFVIDRASTGELAFAARLRDPSSRRTLELFTTEPGIQLYIGGGLNATGKNGAHYAAHAGLALEPQHFPNSPNESSFPTTILRPGETFVSRTVYRFGA